MSKSKPNIVILGAGAAGATLARTLSAALPIETPYDLVLISDRDTYVHRLSLLRLVASDDEKELEEKTFVPFTGLFQPRRVGRVVQGKAIAVYTPSSPGRDGYVQLEGGNEISFRYLVVATGSTWNGPTDIPSGNKNDVTAFFSEWRQKFRDAPSIVLAGGGSVALELAGELRDVYPNKPITIVHKDDHVLNDTYPLSFREDVERRWGTSGIQFIFNDQVEFKDGVASTQTVNGKPLDDSLIVPTYGTKPNTSMLRTLGDGVLDERGLVRIEPSLNIKGHPGIFAAGDIISFTEQKQFAKVSGHVAVIVPNLLSVVSGKQPTKVYQGASEMIAITNGKHKGAGYLGILWGVTLGNILVPMLKGKDLAVRQTRKLLGITD